MTLTEFLLARIADDEAWVRAKWNGRTGLTDERWWQTPIQPSRLLAECEAKRAIVTLHMRVPVHNPDLHPDACDSCGCADTYPTRWPCETIRHVAAVYADHPDYDEAWRV